MIHLILSKSNLVSYCHLWFLAVMCHQKFLQQIDNAEPDEVDSKPCLYQEAVWWQKLHLFCIPGRLFGTCWTSKWDINRCPKGLCVGTITIIYWTTMDWDDLNKMEREDRRKGNGTTTDKINFGNCRINNRVWIPTLDTTFTLCKIICVTKQQQMYDWWRSSWATLEWD